MIIATLHVFQIPSFNWEYIVHTCDYCVTIRVNAHRYSDLRIPVNMYKYHCGEKRECLHKILTCPRNFSVQIVFTITFVFTKSSYVITSSKRVLCKCHHKFFTTLMSSHVFSSLHWRPPKWRVSSQDNRSSSQILHNYLSVHDRTTPKWGHAIDALKHHERVLTQNTPVWAKNLWITSHDLCAPSP